MQRTRLKFINARLAERLRLERERQLKMLASLYALSDPTTSAAKRFIEDHVKGEKQPTAAQLRTARLALFTIVQSVLDGDGWDALKELEKKREPLPKKYKAALSVIGSKLKRLEKPPADEEELRHIADHEEYFEQPVHPLLLKESRFYWCAEDILFELMALAPEFENVDLISAGKWTRVTRLAKESGGGHGKKFIGPYVLLARLIIACGAFGVKERNETKLANVIRAAVSNSKKPSRAKKPSDRSKSG